MELHGDLHGGSWSSMELRGGLHGVPDNVGRRPEPQIIVTFNGKYLLIVMSDGSYREHYTKLRILLTQCKNR